MLDGGRGLRRRVRNVIDPFAIRLPDVPIARQRTTRSSRHDELVIEAVRTTAADATKIVPTASAPVPEYRLKVPLPGVVPLDS